MYGKILARRGSLFGGPVNARRPELPAYGSTARPMWQPPQTPTLAAPPSEGVGPLDTGHAQALADDRAVRQQSVPVTDPNAHAAQLYNQGLDTRRGQTAAAYYERNRSRRLADEAAEREAREARSPGPTATVTARRVT